MAKGQRLKPEQIVTLLRQIDVLTTNGKTLAQACKEVGTVEQSYYRWRKMYGGMKVDQAKKYKELEQENTRLKKLVAARAGKHPTQEACCRLIATRGDAQGSH